MPSGGLRLPPGPRCIAPPCHRRWAGSYRGSPPLWPPGGKPFPGEVSLLCPWTFLLCLYSFQSCVFSVIRGLSSYYDFSSLFEHTFTRQNVMSAKLSAVQYIEEKQLIKFIAIATPNPATLW